MLGAVKTRVMLLKPIFTPHCPNMPPSPLVPARVMRAIAIFKRQSAQKKGNEMLLLLLIVYLVFSYLISLYPLTPPLFPAATPTLKLAKIQTSSSQASYPLTSPRTPAPPSPKPSPTLGQARCLPPPSCVLPLAVTALSTVRGGSAQRPPNRSATGGGEAVGGRCRGGGGGGGDGRLV